MADRRGTPAISDRILPVVYDPERKCYALQRRDFSPFGGTEYETAETYARQLQGCRHERARVCDNGETIEDALVLADRHDEANAFVEIDDWASPLRVTEAGLDAIRDAEEILAQRLDPVADSARFELLFSRLKDESVPLRVSMVKRMWRLYSVENGIPQEGLRGTLLSLLPWESVVSRFESLTVLFSDLTRHPTERSDEAYFNRVSTYQVGPVAHLPALRYYFVYFHPGFAPATESLCRALGRWVEQSGVTALEAEPNDSVSSLLWSLRVFIDTCWDSPLPDLPQEVQKRLAVLLSRLIGFVSSHRLEVTSGDVRHYISQETCYLYLLYMLVRRAGDKGDLESELRNLAGALIAADQGELFGERTRYMSFLMEAVYDVARQLEEDYSSEPGELLEDSSLHSFEERPFEKPYAVLHAADVLRFHAQYSCLGRRGDAALALQYASSSERFYERAAKFIGRLRKDSGQVEAGERSAPAADAFAGKVWDRYRRILKLLMKIQLQLGEDTAARDTLQRIYTYLDGPWSEAFERDYQRELAKADAAIVVAPHISGKLDLQEKLEARLREVLSVVDIAQDEQAHAQARELLIAFYAEVVDDVPAALQAFDEWRQKLSAMAVSERTTGRAEWLQYRAARLCRETATTDGEFREEATQRMIDLLRDQETNTKAAEEFCDFLLSLPGEARERAIQKLDGQLQPLGPTSPLTHVVLRLIFCEPEAQTEVASVGDALSALVLVAEEDAAAVSAAEDWLVQVARGEKATAIGRKGLSILLEVLSRGLAEHGRGDTLSDSLSRARRFLERILKVLDAAPQDFGRTKDRLIWTTRLMDVALLCRDFSAAEALGSELDRRFPRDGIVALKRAILAIDQSQFDRAAEILDIAIRHENKLGSDGAHPALVDRRAYVALQLAEYEEAEKLYREILAEDDLDTRARFGLGRIYFEFGEEYWPDAFEEWMRTLRLQVEMGDRDDDTRAWLTARTVANLCKQALDSQTGSDVEAWLPTEVARAIQSQSFDTSVVLIDAFRVTGAINERLIEAVLSGVEHVRDAELARRVAQFLMARSIHSAVSGDGQKESMEEWRVEIQGYVEWCQARDVLAEYLAGAKGSYWRALLRRLGRNDMTFTWPAVSGFQEALPDRARLLYRHIHTLGYTTGYYQTAYEAVAEIERQWTVDWVTFTDGVITGMLMNLAGVGDVSIDQPLDHVVPDVSLRSMSDLVGVKNGTSKVGGWTDADALAAMEALVFPANGDWRLTGTRVERTIGMVDETDLKAMMTRGRSFGIGFAGRREAATTDAKIQATCYIETAEPLPVLS